MGRRITCFENVGWSLPVESLAIDISQIVLHEADQPDALTDLLDADVLPREDIAEIDFSPLETDAPVARDGGSIPGTSVTIFSSGRRHLCVGKDH